MFAGRFLDLQQGPDGDGLGLEFEDRVREIRGKARAGAAAPGRTFSKARESLSSPLPMRTSRCAARKPPSSASRSAQFV